MVHLHLEAGDLMLERDAALVLLRGVDVRVSLMARVPPVDLDSRIPDHVEELGEGAEYVAAQDTAPVEELDQNVLVLGHGSERANPEGVPHAEHEVPGRRGDLCPMCSHRRLPFIAPPIGLG
ncbi:hypothetical protein [Nannocystis sp.]|uniref:hypothetical protein n=1 Tax=Nannocystis sp. TaxID=1962667 RepID=UPI0025CD6919|nr:hypothetical protein [Nannocystis sp.]MBK7825018.1 hypothetical protein [Nannocystis sp.]